MWQLEKNRRLTIFRISIFLLFALLIGRLAWMQLWHGPQYKKQAEDNRVRQQIDYAPRGEIRDRNGTAMVSSRPSFAISVVPAEFTNREIAVHVIAAATNMAVESIEKKLATGEKSPYTPLRLKQALDVATLARIEERKRDLPGVIIEPIAVRHYIYGQLAAHLFGYVGNIDEKEYEERKNQGYSLQDYIGKTGLEQRWENRLRGVNGGHQVEINAEGNEVRQIGDKATTPGHSLLLTLDVKLQKAAETALADQIEASKKRGEPAKGGAVVVLDPRTGGVLVMASLPAFDPNVFADGLADSEWSAILNNPNTPLTNRVSEGVYPPASVFKIVTAAAALDTGLTTAAEVFDDKGVYSLNGWQFFGWNTKGLGRLTIADALAWSSDPVFYELGHRLGIDQLASYALTFGYGKTSGLGLPEEAGIVPTEEWKKATFNEPWYPGETLIAAIGQGYYLVTPLQQALLLQAVANRGIVYKPLLVEKVVSPEGETLETFQPEVLRTIYLATETWDTLRKGLLSVTTEGTAASVFKGFTQPIAGKTGSAETGRKATHAWFACFAPVESPEVVVVVFVEDGGEGSTAAAPVARRILDAYFNSR